MRLMLLPLALAALTAAGGCCKLGENKTSWYSINDTGPAVVQVEKRDANGKRLPGIVREGPGPQFGIITSLPSGTYIDVLQNTKGPNGYWSKIRWWGGEGWMHQDVMMKASQQAREEGEQQWHPPVVQGGKYGAIAVNKAQRRWGWSNNQANENAAIQRAMQECGAGCQLAVAFVNQCASLAFATDGGYGWSRQGSRGEADSNALSQCDAIGPGCKIEVSICSL